MFVRLFIIHGANSKPVSPQRDSKVVIAAHQSTEPLQHTSGGYSQPKRHGLGKSRQWYFTVVGKQEETLWASWTYLKSPMQGCPVLKYRKRPVKKQRWWQKETHKEAEMVAHGSRRRSVKKQPQWHAVNCRATIIHSVTSLATLCVSHSYGTFCLLVRITNVSSWWT